MGFLGHKNKCVLGECGAGRQSGRGLKFHCKKRSVCDADEDGTHALLVGGRMGNSQL